MITFANNKSIGTPMLRVNKIKSLTMGVQTKCSKHEFHHVFPGNYLHGLGKEKSEINVITNICFLTGSDNNSIRDKAPRDYQELILSDKKAEYLGAALIPNKFGSMDYEAFLSAREELLVGKAMELMSVD